MARTILLILADAGDAKDVKAWLAHAPGELLVVESVGRCADGLERLASRDKDAVAAVVVDLFLPDSEGMETFSRLHAAAPQVPILVIGRIGDEVVARQVVHQGAQDYLLKGRFDEYALIKALNAMLERAAHAAVLFAEQERARLTLNSIGDAVVSADVAGNVTYLNPVAASMTGWSAPDALGRPLPDVLRIVNANTRAVAANPLAMAMREDRSVSLSPNSVLLHRDGREFAIEDTASPIHDTGGRVTGAVIVFHDVSAARALAQKLSHLAHHDALTGLPNRLLLDDRLKHAMALASRHRKSLAVLFMDVDRLKQVNDSQGHPLGDKLLQAVGVRLAESVRQSDTVARLGGDEFVVLLSEVTCPTDAAISAGKILAAVSAPLTIDGQDMCLAMSVGIAVYPRDGTDAETLLRNADRALLHAKTHGRGGLQLFEPRMGEQGDACPLQASDRPRLTSVQ
jgi:diguanylate cyclase (GGDEF)-like protein/PAS domain S-box-containing protein